jgi:hypothetical protein
VHAVCGFARAFVAEETMRTLDVEDTVEVNALNVHDDPSTEWLAIIIRLPLLDPP